ncbi:MAG TPA: GHMP kinase, partial [Candidatus Diapherotrites archaeon]|nr:GHMP kinase [Candidatus Diapherotrites archaeon]
MIASRTPLRISFCGGGTDFKDYYARHGGAVLSTAIDQYVYLIANKRFEKGIRLGYSQTEIIDRRQQVRHPLFNACMKAAGIDSGIELLSLADIPSKGSGLGSSSSFAVGLLNVLHAYQGKKKPARSLAEQACHVEIGLLREPIGKQDQYIAAYGGFKHITFNSDESVFVQPVICKPHIFQELQKNLLLFYTGISQRSHEVLHEQRRNSHAKKGTLSEMARLAKDLRDSLNEGALDQFGKLLHENWMLKKELSEGISSNLIDEYYEKALRSGASGGKLLGAGGRGFLLMYCEEANQQKVCDSLQEMRKVDFAFE